MDVAKAMEGQGSISARLSHLSHCAEENEEKEAEGNIFLKHAICQIKYKYFPPCSSSSYT